MPNRPRLLSDLSTLHAQLQGLRYCSGLLSAISLAAVPSSVALAPCAQQQVGQQHTHSRHVVQPPGNSPSSICEPRCVRLLSRASMQHLHPKKHPSCSQQQVVKSDHDDQRKLASHICSMRAVPACHQVNFASDSRLSKRLATLTTIPILQLRRQV